MFKLKTDNFSVEKNEGKCFLYADSNMFGNPLRFGDFNMYSCLLFCLKQYLINKYPNRFNQKNLFFKLVIHKNTMGFKDFNLIKHFYANIWDGSVDKPNNKYNVRQLINGGNIWAFKTFCEHKNIKLDDPMFNNKHVIHTSPFQLTPLTKNKTYLFPILNKKYNTERNFSKQLISRIIDQTNSLTIITKDIPHNQLQMLKQFIPTDVSIIGNEKSWPSILLSIMSDCKKFISGDCGLSHFVSLLPYTCKPEMEIYYKTKAYLNKNPINQFDHAYKLINFKPYNFYTNDIINIKNF